MPTLRDVGPSLAVYGLTDSGLVYSDFFSELPLGLAGLESSAYFSDFICGQFGLRKRFADRLSALGGFVGGVIGSCSEKQVIWPNARWRVAAMQHAQPVRYRSERALVGIAMRES